MQNRFKPVSKLALCTAMFVGMNAIPKPGYVGMPIVKADETQPNVILIIADDLGWGDVRLNNPLSAADTPNISSIAENGVNFSQGYVAAPVCCPSRACLISSQSAASIGFDSNVSGRNNFERIGSDTIAMAMKDLGYNTTAIGKWDLGDGDYIAGKRGFDSFFGFPGGRNSYYPTNAPADAVHLNANRQVQVGGKITVQPARNIQRYDPATGVNVADVADGHLTDIFTDKATDYIDSYDSDKPFFMYLSHHVPHFPLQVPQNYYDMFSDITDPAKRIYAAMIKHMDDRIGDVFDSLENKGISENTVVIFMSDNGGVADGVVDVAGPTVGPADNGNLRGGKYDVFEGGVRVPLAMKWPGHITPGQTFNQPVSTVDLLPTIAAIGGMPSSQFASHAWIGHDLMPYITGEKTGTIHDSLVWRYVKVADGNGMLKYCLRKGDYKYIYTQQQWTGESNQYIFHLPTNPGENDSMNLYGLPEYAEMEEEYKTQLAEWDETMAGVPNGYTRFSEIDESDNSTSPIVYSDVELDSNMKLWDIQADTKHTIDGQDGTFLTESYATYNEGNNLFTDNSNSITQTSGIQFPQNVWGIGKHTGNNLLKLTQMKMVPYSNQDMSDGTARTFNNVYKVGPAVGSAGIVNQHCLFYSTQLPPIATTNDEYFLLSLWLRHYQALSPTPNMYLSMAFSDDVPSSFNTISYTPYYINGGGLASVFGSNLSVGTTVNGKWQQYQTVVHIPKDMADSGSQLLFQLKLHGMGVTAGNEIHVADPVLAPISLFSAKIASDKEKVTFSEGEDEVNIAAQLYKSGTAVSSWEVWNDKACTIEASDGITISETDALSAKLQFDSSDSNLESGTVYVRLKLNDNPATYSNVVAVNYSKNPSSVEISGLPESITIKHGQILSFPLTAQADYTGASFSWSLPAESASGIKLSRNAGSTVTLYVDNRDGSLSSGEISVVATGTGGVEGFATAMCNASADTVSNIPLIRLPVGGEEPEEKTGVISGTVSGTAAGVGVHVPMSGSTALSQVGGADDYEANQWSYQLASNSECAYVNADDAPVEYSDVIRLRNNSADNNTVSIGANGGFFQRSPISIPEGGQYYYSSGYIKYVSGNLKSSADRDIVLRFGVFDDVMGVNGNMTSCAAAYNVPLSEIVDTETNGGTWQKFEYVFWLPYDFNGKYFDTRIFCNGSNMGQFEWLLSDFRMIPFVQAADSITRVTNNSDGSATVEISSPLSSPDKVLVVLAYNQNTLVGIKLLKANNFETPQSRLINVNFDDIINITEFKAMLWENADNMRPLCDAKSDSD